MQRPERRLLEYGSRLMEKMWSVISLLISTPFLHLAQGRK
ncbi:MAG: hypothetical protein ACJAYV_002484 [Oleispira sp.]|jgi:hypothetical protein